METKRTNTQAIKKKKKKTQRNRTREAKENPEDNSLLFLDSKDETVLLP